MFYISVCGYRVYGCVYMGVSTCNWMLIFIYKGAYCNFSLWGFYDTVWQMLFCQTGCCKACFILFFRIICPFLISCVKWSFEKNYVYCAFYWTVILTDFIPTLNKQKPERMFCILLQHVDWFPDSIDSCWLQYWLYVEIICLFTSIALRLCSSNVHVFLWTKSHHLHYSIWHYSGFIKALKISCSKQ